MFDPKSPPLVWLFLGLRIEKGIFYFFLFGGCCGDLKRRDFWDWLFGRVFDVEFVACFKKASLRISKKKKKLPFWLGLTGLGGDRSEPGEKIRLVNGSSLGRGSGPGMKNPVRTRPVVIPNLMR